MLMAAHGPAFDDFHTIAWLTEIIFVMHQECMGTTNVAFEFRVLHLTVDAYRYRLHHFIAHDFTY